MRKSDLTTEEIAAIGRMTLAEALREADTVRWAGMRSQERSYGQAALAIMDLQALGCVKVSDVSVNNLKIAARKWLAAGLSKSTINCRMSCLSSIGVTVRGARVRPDKATKWWLSAQQEEYLVSALAELGGFEELILLIRWTTRSGLRIEESLRLQWFNLMEAPPKGDEVVPRYSMSVPGTKTSISQATLPLTTEAARIMIAHRATLPRQTVVDMVFKLPYRDLSKQWHVTAKKLLGVEKIPTATLKALRRSAARYLHASKGMPLDMVRQYLRHDNISTTMEYLRLTGGYGEQEMRDWL